MGWNGNATGPWARLHEGHLLDGHEAALNMYAQYAYTNDADYLKNTAYPFMREVVKFYVKKLSKDAAASTTWRCPTRTRRTGREERHHGSGAVRSLFPIAIKTSTALGLDAALRPEWQAVLTTWWPTRRTRPTTWRTSRRSRNSATARTWPPS